MSYKKFYTCKYDRPFKEIFLNEKNKKLLKGLLETILKTKINNIEIKPNERINGNLKLKKKIFDALIYTKNKKIGIEVNSQIKEFTRNRNMSYICDMYSTNTLVGKTYNNDIDIIQINLTYGLKDSKPYRIYKVRDEELKEYVENFYIYEINMDYYKKLWYIKSELVMENKYLVMLDLEEKELNEFSKKDKEVGFYMGEIKKLNGEVVFRSLMSYEEDQQKIHNTEMELARKKGIEQGIEKGIEKESKRSKLEKIEMAKAMIKDNLSFELVSKYTKLTKDELDGIL